MALLTISNMRVADLRVDPAGYHAPERSICMPDRQLQSAAEGGERLGCPQVVA